MLASFSSWQDSSDRRIIIMGDHPSTNRKVHKRDLKIMCQELKHMEDMGQVTFISESAGKYSSLETLPSIPPVESTSASRFFQKKQKRRQKKKRAPNVRDAAPSLSSTAGADAKTPSRMHETIIAELPSEFARSFEFPENVQRIRVDTEIFVHLASHWMRVQEYWKPLGTTPNEEQDRKRMKQWFLQQGDEISLSRIISFAQELAQQTDQQLQQIEATFPTIFNTLRERLTRFNNAVIEAEGWNNRYKDVDDKEVFGEIEDDADGDQKDQLPTNSLSRVFFKALKKEQASALEAFANWSGQICLVGRDLVTAAHLINFLLVPIQNSDCTDQNDVKDEQKSPPIYGSGPRLVLFLENNLALSFVELVSSAGFACRGFSGSLQRMHPTQAITNCQPIERPYMKSLMDKFFKFPKTAVDNCASCGLADAVNRCARCKSVLYCDATCQRKHWSTHKRECKMLKKQYEERHAAHLAQQSQP